jgi:hypothetical protein
VKGDGKLAAQACGEVEVAFPEDNGAEEYVENMERA